MSERKIKDPRIIKAVDEFIAKMNALGITPLIDADDRHVVMAWKLSEMLQSLKKSLLKQGVPEGQLKIELIPFGSDYYIRVTVWK